MSKITKLSSAKRSRLEQVRFWMNPEASQHLRELRQHYADLLGREVSTSLVMRRALGMLTDHVRATESDPQAELAALARVLL